MTDEERQTFQTKLTVALRTELAKLVSAAGLRLSTFDVAVSPAGLDVLGRITVEFAAGPAAKPAQVAAGAWVDQSPPKPAEPEGE